MKNRSLIKRFLIACTILVAQQAIGQDRNCTQRDNSSRPDCPAALIFFNHLQNALRNDDRVTISSLIAYPALTSIRHKRTHIRDRRQFLAHFDEIFNKGVRCVILRASDKDLWGNWRGFTIDGGAVWFDAIVPTGKKPDINSSDYWTKYPMKIITINNDSVYPCQSEYGG